MLIIKLIPLLIIIVFAGFVTAEFTLSLLNKDKVVIPLTTETGDKIFTCIGIVIVRIVMLCFSIYYILFYIQ